MIGIHRGVYPVGIYARDFLCFLLLSKLVMMTVGDEVGDIGF